MLYFNQSQTSWLELEVQLYITFRTFSLHQITNSISQSHSHIPPTFLPEKLPLYHSLPPFHEPPPLCYYQPITHRKPPFKLSQHSTTQTLLDATSYKSQLSAPFDKLLLFIVQHSCEFILDLLSLYPCSVRFYMIKM